MESSIEHKHPLFNTHGNSTLGLCLHSIVFRKINGAFGELKTHLLLHHLTEKKIKGGKLAATLDKYCAKLMKNGFKSMIEQEQTTNALSLKNFQCSKTEISVRMRDKGFKELARKLFLTTRELEKEKYQKKILNQQIQQCLKSKEIEGMKKKQSLEMLAEEICQKNQRIEQLQITLKKYEEKQGSINILDDAAFYCKELQKMEKINEKIRYQLSNKTQKISNFQKQIISLKKRIEQFHQENLQNKQKLFNAQQAIKTVEILKNQNQRLKKFIDKKISQIRKTQKTINSQRRNNSIPSLKITSSFEQINPISQLQAHAQDLRIDYKVEKILNFIYNLDQTESQSLTNINYLISLKEILDEEEYQVLVDLKTKIINLNLKVQEKSALLQKQSLSLQVREIEQQKINLLENKKYYCLKIKELQAEKTRNNQKTAQLKNKFFCIRNIVMNFVKSLQFQHMKRQTNDIFSLLCDLFEYSEEEKQAMSHNKKKKGFFDF